MLKCWREIFCLDVGSTRYVAFIVLLLVVLHNLQINPSSVEVTVRLSVINTWTVFTCLQAMQYKLLYEYMLMLQEHRPCINCNHCGLEFWDLNQAAMVVEDTYYCLLNRA